MQGKKKGTASLLSKEGRGVIIRTTKWPPRYCRVGSQGVALPGKRGKHVMRCEGGEKGAWSELVVMPRKKTTQHVSVRNGMFITYSTETEYKDDRRRVRSPAGNVTTDCAVELKAVKDNASFRASRGSLEKRERRSGVRSTRSNS